MQEQQAIFKRGHICLSDGQESNDGRGHHFAYLKNNYVLSVLIPCFFKKKVVLLKEKGNTIMHIYSCMYNLLGPPSG